MNRWIAFILMALSVLTVSAQQMDDLELRGLVTDNTGEPLPGATVRIVNTQFGTMTDANGHYILRGRWKKGSTIQFSFMGMKEVRMEYTGQKVQDAAMQQDSKALGEVVVTARQNINEMDIRAKSGVVQEVDMARLNSKPMIDMSLALQGSVPGLIVTNTGDLGSKPTIRIRGNSSLRQGDAANEPLYVMDGQVISSDAFMTLNPADIKEIKVLKDAVASALYGIKAANGVIEITSLRGNPDGQLTTAYSFNIGITARGRRGVELMDTDEKLELERRLKNLSSPGYIYSADYYRTYYANSPNLDQMIAYGQGVIDSLKTIHTDWFDELIKRNIYQKHNLSIKGGTEKTSYYVSVNYTQQGGRVEGNNTQRITARMSLDQKLGKWGYLSLGADAGYSMTDTPNGSSYSPTDLVYQLNPYETKNGKLYSFSESSDYTYKDLISQYQAKSDDKRGGVSASLNLEPINGLRIDAVGGIDMVLTEEMTLVPSTSIYERTHGIPVAERGKLTKSKKVDTNVSSNIRITYAKTFDEKHDLTVGGNMDYYMTDNDGVGIIGYGVGTHMSPANINQAITGSRKPEVSSTKEKTAQLGFGLVAGYTFDNTYDLFASYKWDASSVLPKDKRWNAAWAIGLGWTLTQYPFLQDNKVITCLNLKGSYGRIANLAGVSAAETIGTFSYSTDYYGNSRLLQLMALYNTDLKAEQTASTDLSVSLELFKRITLDANVYRRETSDALLSVPVPLSNGFSNMTRNIGVLRNEGYELSASFRILDQSDLRFSVGGSLAYNRNKVVDLYYTDRLYASEEDLTPTYEVGKAYDLVYGLKSLGINPITGLPVFQAGDGSEVDAMNAVKKENIVELGHSTPPYSGSINLSASYKDFDLDMDFYYVFGGIKQYNYSYVRWTDNANKNAIKGQLEKMWFQKGDENKVYHSPFYSSSNIYALTYPNTLTVGKSDYLKLSMVSLRYRVPHQVLERSVPFIKYANMSFQASNLFTLTPYKESDPETGSLAGTTQPVYTINLSLTF